MQLFRGRTRILPAGSTAQSPDLPWTPQRQRSVARVDERNPNDPFDRYHDPFRIDAVAAASPQLLSSRETHGPQTERGAVPITANGR
ncbi:MAG: hypothetical protein WKF60_10110 [Ilumatobacter sp.]